MFYAENIILLQFEEYTRKIKKTLNNSYLFSFAEWLVFNFFFKNPFYNKYPTKI